MRQTTPSWRDGPLYARLKFQLWLSAPIAAIAFLIGLAGATSAGLGFLLMLLGVPAAALVILIGSVVSLIDSIRHFREVSPAAARLLAPLIPPVAALATILLFLPSAWAGSMIGTYGRLALNHGRYEAIIEQARIGPKPEWYAEQDGIIYNVDVGPPVRVAFHPEGLLDNWSGIIFDPTGDVMLAEGFDAQGKFTAPDRITKLFGGDLMRCRHLWGDYYRCSFT